MYKLLRVLSAQNVAVFSFSPLLPASIVPNNVLFDDTTEHHPLAHLLDAVRDIIRILVLVLVLSRSNAREPEAPLAQCLSVLLMRLLVLLVEIVWCVRGVEQRCRTASTT